MKEKTIEMFPAAKKFIEEYGMLEIYLPINPRYSEENIEKYKFDRFTYHTTNMTSSIINGLMTRYYG